MFFFFFFFFFGYFELSIYAEQREKKKMSDVRPRNRRSQKGIIKRSLTICALSILLFASRVVSEALNGRVVEEGDRTQREKEDTKKLYRGVNFFDAPFGDVNAKDVPSNNNNNNNNNNAGVSVAAFAPRRALQVSARAFRSFLLTKEFSLGISKPPFHAFRFVFAFASEANDHSSPICIAEKRG